jgi:hypothetical protein
MNNLNTYNNFDAFSQSTPDLINKKVVKQFKFVFDTAGKQASNSINNETPWSDSLSNFYCEYVQQNLLILILLFIFALFLVYKYYTKDIQEDYHNIKSSKLKKYIKEQDEIDFRPTFNPFYPVKDQTSYVNYVADDIPIENEHGKLVRYYDEHPDEFIKINKYRPPYDTNDENVYYSGIYNTYANAQDSAYPNELGEIDDYNTTTERAVRSMTDRNRDNLDLLAEILFENDKQLINQ